MPKVSVIIPVYRAATTIATCLDSVLAQTLDELEIVLVDDHGFDFSMDKARKRLASYTGSKTVVFTETPVNEGPGAARNRGIEAATGDYVAFLDADDTIDPNFCQALYEAAQAVDADMAFGYISFDRPDGTSEVRHNPGVTAGPFTGKAKRRYLQQVKSYFTTYLYRHSLLTDNDIRFPGTHSAEDSCFLLCSLLCAEIIASAEVGYHYAIQPGSVSQRRDPQRWSNRLASFGHLEAFARAKGLWRPYRATLRLLIFKKGWLLAAKDFLKNNLG